MERAQGQPVLDGVGPAGRVPHDVGRVDAYQHVPDARLEPAHGAPVAVGSEDGLTERRVSPATWRPQRASPHDLRLDIEPDRVEDIVVERRREVGVEEDVRNLGDERGVTLERPDHAVWEPTGGVDGPERRERRVAVALPPNEPICSI